MTTFLLLALLVAVGLLTYALDKYFVRLRASLDDFKRQLEAMHLELRHIDTALGQQRQLIDAMVRNRETTGETK